MPAMPAPENDWRDFKANLRPRMVVDGGAEVGAGRGQMAVVGTAPSKSPGVRFNMGVSENGGYPQIINFSGFFHYKPSIFGHPYLGNHHMVP